MSKFTISHNFIQNALLVLATVALAIAMGMIVYFVLSQTILHCDLECRLEKVEQRAIECMEFGILSEAECRDFAIVEIGGE